MRTLGFINLDMLKPRNSFLNFTDLFDSGLRWVYFICVTRETAFVKDRDVLRLRVLTHQ